MDRNSLLGLLLIGALLIGYSIWTRPSEEEIKERQRIQDSVAQVEARERLEAEKARLEKEAELKREGNLDWIKFSSRFKDVYVHKNQVTIKMSTSLWLENFRKQELERYKYPLLPWAYQTPAGTCRLPALP